jgi:hypothetical protein
MTDFDYTDDGFAEEESAEKKKRKINALDIFSVLLVIATLCLGSYFLMIFLNPYTAMNPLQPNTPVPPIVIPSATITPRQLPTAWTSTPTIQPSITPTSRPTFTPIPTETPLILYTETFTPEAPTATATPEMPFTADIQWIDRKIIDSESNCDWLGVGGTVEDLNKSPMLGVVIRVRGTLAEETVDLMTVSGVSQAYGKSGFEFTLGDLPIASEGSLWIQLLDAAGLPLSDPIYFNTSADCDKSLVLVQFRQVR